MEKEPYEKISYNNDYAKNNYDRITILRRKDADVTKKDIDRIAKDRGMKTSEFVNMCIDEKLKRLKINV